MRTTLFFTVTIFFNAMANILIKVGMNGIGQTSGYLQLIKKAVVNPALLLGISFFTLGFVFYCYVLSRANLSVAYPIITSVGYMLVIIVSWLYLRETIVVPQLVGFALIMTGVWLVAK